MLTEPIRRHPVPDVFDPFPEGWYFVASRESILK